MNAAEAPPAVDFAVVGNASETLTWLRRILSSMLGVRLVGDPGSGPGADEVQRTGVVARYLPEDPSVALAAGRLAIVLEDPVWLLARSGEGGDGLVKPGRYAETLREVLASRSERPLVLAADELRSSGGCLAELAEHLGLARPEGPRARPRTPLHEPLTVATRAKLFCAIRDDVEELERLAGRTFHTWRPGTGGVNEPASGRHLVYVGRRRDVEVPRSCVSLTDWDVLPHRLGPLLDDASTLTLLDPMSFPLDALRERDRAIPTAVRLPRGWEANELIALLGHPLLDELTAFDAVNVSSDEIWGALQTHYAWPSRMRAELDELAGFGAWASPRAAKAAHRTVTPPVLGALRAAAQVIPRGESLRALVLSDDADRWTPLLARTEVKLTAVELDPSQAWARPTALPDWRLERCIPDEEPERFHLALSAFALCSADQAERARRIASIFRAVRVGGRVAVIDRFLDGRAGRRLDGPGPRELLSEINHATGRHVVLEHVEALRWPEEALVSVGLFTLTKIGPTERL